MIYIKRFTKQDLRATGGGSNTLIASNVVSSGFFPAPKRPPGDSIKIYYATSFKILEYGYSGLVLTSNEVRIKSFSSIMTAAGATIGDIGVFRKVLTEANAYEVTFVKKADTNFDFYNKLLGSGNHSANETVFDPGVPDPDPIFDKFPKNWLIYGAPGTGKSNFLEGEAVPFKFNKKRITFYPDYSYAKFVGSYKPSPYYKNTGVNTVSYHQTKIDATPHTENINEPVIDYTFVPGPFLEVLIECYRSAAANENFVLLIEELNRANAAAVFGEVFQLLDRKNGKSEYRVKLSKEAMDYINEELNDATYNDLKNDIRQNGIYIPPNFFLWATMNSADQGVFPLDAAFKRRWQVQYLPLNQNENKLPPVSLTFAGIPYKWNYLRKAVNSYLSKKTGLAEDRLIAPFFLSLDQLSDSGNLNDTFKNKVLLYLKDDVLRHKKGFFNEDNQTLSSIHEHFSNNPDESKNYDFFSILTQGPEGAASYLKEIYNELIEAEKKSTETLNESVETDNTNLDNNTSSSETTDSTSDSDNSESKE